MNDDFKLCQALVKHLTTVKSSNGWSYEIALDGKTFSPVVGSIHLREFVMPVSNSHIGLSQKGSEYQEGIYQIDVCTPKGSGKWKNLEICGVLKNSFLVGEVLSEDDQKLKIYKYMKSAIRPEENWNVISNSFYFTAIN